jgi:hypothetical protein
MSDSDTYENIRRAQEGEHYYLLVDERIILRTTDKRTLEYYYDQMMSDDWQGERVITPTPTIPRV